MMGRFDNIHPELSCEQARIILASSPDQLDSQSDFYMAAAHLINCPCKESHHSLINFLSLQGSEQAISIAKRKAVEVLARLQVSEAVPEIGKCLWSDDVYLVENSVWALQKLCCSSPVLIEKMIALMSDDRQSTRVLIQALTQLKVTAASASIFPFQEDQRPGVKGAAIAAISVLEGRQDRISEVGDHLLLPNQMDRQCAIQDLIDAGAFGMINQIVRSPVSPVFRMRALRSLVFNAGPEIDFLGQADMILLDNPTSLHLVHKYDDFPCIEFLVGELFSTDFSRCYLALTSLVDCNSTELWAVLEEVWRDRAWNDYGAHYFIIRLLGLRFDWPDFALQVIKSLLDETVSNLRPQFQKSRAAAIVSMSGLFPKNFLASANDLIRPVETPVWECRYVTWLALERLFLAGNELSMSWLDFPLSELNETDEFVRLRAQKFQLCSKAG
ncbi:bilin biosynthesis protein CpeY [bacterium]|nr:bilin biosynthesis protein CpeY [bacterium]